MACSMLAAHQIVLNSASLTYMVPAGRFGGSGYFRQSRRRGRESGSRRRNGSMAIAIGAVFMAMAATAFLTIPL
jgi:hypothetical protein